MIFIIGREWRVGKHVPCFLVRMLNHPESRSREDVFLRILIGTFWGRSEGEKASVERSQRREQGENKGRSHLAGLSEE